ncbi:TPA: hypothetical protein ACV965_001447 [Yersinia enterocolitica]
MREVTEQYVEREEKCEVFQQDALRAWANYQQTGLHLTRIEADNCLERFEAGNDTALPEFHDWSGHAPHWSICSGFTVYWLFATSEKMDIKF